MYVNDGQGGVGPRQAPSRGPCNAVHELPVHTTRPRRRLLAVLPRSCREVLLVPRACYHAHPVQRTRTLDLVLVLLVAACDRAPEPASQPSAPATATAPTAAPTAAPTTPPAVPTAPTTPSADRFTSSDGLVGAPRPSGDGWECVEQTATDPGQEATLIKCRHTDRSRFFFLMAKDYSVPPEQVRPAEELATQVFPATYQKLFQSHQIRGSKPVDHAGVPAHELDIEAVHASMGPIRKRERVFIKGTHVFVISAEGKPEEFDAEAAAITAWFAGAAFKNAS